VYYGGLSHEEKKLTPSIDDSSVEYSLFNVCTCITLVKDSVKVGTEMCFIFRIRLSSDESGNHFWR